VLVALAHIVALAVLAAHAALIWRDVRAGHALHARRWLVAAAVPLALLLPVMAKGITQKDAISWFKADAAAVRGLPEDMFGSAHVALLVIVLALIASVAMARVDRRPLVLLLTWAVVPPVFCYLTFPVLHVFLYRYLLFTVPAWVLLAAALPRLLARGTTRRWPVVAGALVLPVVVGLVGLPDQEDARRLPLHEPDFAPAARIVQAHLHDGDGIVFAETRRDGRRAFAYLHAIGVVGVPKDVLRERPASEIGWFRPTECLDTDRCLAGTNRIWLIADAEPGPDRVEGISRRAQLALRSEFDRELVGSARQIKVYLLERTAR
jgi:mannosyltransferase